VARRNQYLRAAGAPKSGSLWALARGVIASGRQHGLDCPACATRLPARHCSAPLPAAHKGIYIIENLNLKELARDPTHRFAFVGIPLKFARHRLAVCGPGGALE